MKKKFSLLYVVAALLALVCFGAVFGMIYNETILPEFKYNQACAYVENEDYVAAYEILASLGDYKDSSRIKEEIYDRYKISAYIDSLQIGQLITMGEYEQDNNLNNGTEKIEWIVIGKEKGRALVVSKYALCARTYHDTYAAVYWETSDIRQWLNEEFYAQAFTEDERGQIINSYVPAHEFYAYATKAGNPTYDKLFLLSYVEIHEYMGDNLDRGCPATEYAKAQGLHESADGTCRWWTRTPGGLQNRATFVQYNGGINALGYFVDTPNYGVRPAMWIGQ